MQNFVKRKIDVTINVGKGEFGAEKGTDVTLTGHRVSCTTVYAGGASQGETHLRIYGLPLQMINQLTGTGGVFAKQTRNNTILVSAGSEGGGVMSGVYQGQISQAWGNFEGAPEVVFEIIALAAAVEAVRPVGASSYRGATDAANVMQNLATDMKLVFENSQGLSVMLQNPYFPGTNLSKVESCARAAGFEYSIEFGKLAIFPAQGFRNIGKPLIVSAATGMVGYPNFAAQGISVTTIFNPDIVMARQIQIVSDLVPACGIWNVVGVAHSLESETPNGQWFTTANCVRAA